MATYAQVIADIDKVASSLGVDTDLALAIAMEESGLNPDILQKGGGGGVGLYQLTPGGELGNLTTAQAQNPITNATIALGEVHAVAVANPGATPGAIALLAQRPQDYVPGMTAAQAAQTQYAQSIDANYAAIKAKGIDAVIGGASVATSQDNAANSAGAVTPGVFAPTVSSAWSNIGHDLIFFGLVAGQFIAGAVLALLGIKQFLSPSVAGLPELAWCLVGAGAVLCWSAVSLQSAACVIEHTVNGATSSCKLSSLQSISLPNLGKTAGEKLVNALVP